MITGKHVKAARAVLGIGIRELASLAGVNPNTVVNFEHGGLSRSDTVERLQRTLEARGIEFLDTGNPGIRWKR